MNARRNPKGAITAITHQNATAVMAKRSSDIIITAARIVDKGVVDVEEHDTWEQAQNACTICERNVKQRTKA